MIKTLKIITITAFVSIIVTLYFSGIYFNSIIQKQVEEKRLQDIAFSQLLSEHLDNNDIHLLRESVDANLTASLAHTSPENSYNHIHTDACKIHQFIHEYRKKHPQYYSTENPEEKAAEKALKYWQGKICDN